MPPENCARLEEPEFSAKIVQFALAAGQTSVEIRSNFAISLHVVASFSFLLLMNMVCVHSEEGGLIQASLNGRLKSRLAILCESTSDDAKLLELVITTCAREKNRSKGRELAKCLFRNKF